MTQSNSKINQDDINKAAWAACDTFRGVLDPSQYKDYILVMLFLKYVSDVWNAHLADYQGLYGDDEERINRKLKLERFVLPEVIHRVEKEDPVTKEKSMEEVDRFVASYYSLYERRSQDNIGELINMVLEHIESENKTKLVGVFRNIDFNSEANLGRVTDRNRRLKNLLEDFHKPELGMSPHRVSADVIGSTYIYLISRFASDSGKKAGEFFTPQCVTDIVAKLAQPQPGQRICDPTCGSGGLLIQAARETNSLDFSLYGQEVNGSTFALCRMNMFLHGYDSARIEWGDTINSPLLIESDKLMRFDRVVANPPFSLDKWGAENADADPFKRFWRGVPPRGKGDWAFITHTVETALEQQGRVVIVVPHGVLFRGAKEGVIRQALIKENLLDAVIGLPSNLFFSASIPVAILVFDRAREKGGALAHRKDVLFIDASRDFTAGKKQNDLSADHIQAIVDTFLARKSIPKFSALASLQQIAENDFNLNIPRYVDTFEAEPEIDISAVQAEIDALELELVSIRATMQKYLAELKQ